MSRLSSFVLTQARFALANFRHAMLCAVILAVFPYTLWLSNAFIALIALRRGVKEGGILLVLVMAIHWMMGVSLSMIPSIAMINTLLIFIPCFAAACLLRISASWQVVAGGLFLQAFVVVLAVHLFAPDFIMSQFMQFKRILADLQPENSMLALMDGVGESSQPLLANYFLGIQAAGALLSVTLSLMLARWMQSALYYPEGYRRELFGFRSNKLGLILMLVTLCLALQGHVLASNLLPTLMLYFILTAFGLLFAIFSQRSAFSSLLILVAPLLLLPFIVLPVYVIIGSLDSVFNFRLYLPKRADKRT